MKQLLKYKKALPLSTAIKTACIGLGELFIHERNFRLLSFYALCNLTFYLITNQSFVGLFIILFGNILILMAEATNTLIEQICDFITTDYNVQIKKIKDLAAGMSFGILIVQMISYVLVMIIFWPN